MHTPGPWNYYTEPQPNGCPIIGARGLMVAMLAHTINQDEQKETAIANARLIAVAPELLAMLGQIKEAEFGFGRWPTLYEINALIAKAKGGAA